jgi:DNA-binding transcriptional LysR family regulator
MPDYYRLAVCDKDDNNELTFKCDLITYLTADLQLFVRTADTGSLSKAARDLDQSPATASHDVDNGKLHTILDAHTGETSPLHAVYLHRNGMSPATRSLITFIRNKFASA